MEFPSVYTYRRSMIRFTKALSNDDLSAIIKRLSAPENNRCAFASMGNALKLPFAKREAMRRGIIRE